MNLDGFMAAIRQNESGGNYAAMGVPTNYGRATGAYQFIDATWGGYGGYKRAAQAPPAVQDAKAKQLMQSYFDYVSKNAPNMSNDEKWGVVAMGWMGGRGAMDNYIKHGHSLSYDPYSKLTPEAYAARVMGTKVKGSASSASTTTGSTQPGPEPVKQQTFEEYIGETLPSLLQSIGGDVGPQSAVSQIGSATDAVQPAVVPPEDPSMVMS